MQSNDRYSTAGLDENEYEPGSHDKVLKNLCGITTIAGIEQAETLALLKSTEEMLDRFDQHHRFTAQDICIMHKAWLGSIYSWAGSYRQVMMSKDGFPFAAPAYIPTLMNAFEKEILAHHTPCPINSVQCVESLAIVHVELVLIHPFREGNGRLARLLATLMGLQAGLPILLFETMEADDRKAYFAAIRAGVERNYHPMQSMFAKIIEQSGADV
jgi:cell filamentation protein